MSAGQSWTVDGPQMGEQWWRETAILWRQRAEEAEATRAAAVDAIDERHALESRIASAERAMVDARTILTDGGHDGWKDDAGCGARRVLDAHLTRYVDETKAAE